MAVLTLGLEDVVTKGQSGRLVTAVLTLGLEDVVTKCHIHTYKWLPSNCCINVRIVT